MKTSKRLRELFRELLRIRMIEERIAVEYQKQEMRCPTHLSIGQEAIAVGVCSHLRTEDIVFSGHRSHAHYFAKGGDVSAMIAELYGKATGCSGGFGGSQHLIDLSVNFWGSSPIVGSTIPVAVGVALAIRMKKEHRIVVSFFGDGATEEGVFFESANFAALHKLPVLFVCENNLYSTNTHIRERQPKRSIFSIASVLGFRTYQEDGNDVLKVETLAKKVISSVRQGDGPNFIEYLTYRTRSHVGPNYDAEGYRPQAEKIYWAKRDPVTRTERYLRQRNLINNQKMKLMKQVIESGIDKAFDFAKKSPFPLEALNERMVYAQ